MDERWLVLETSGRGGRVGMAAGAQVVRSAALDPARRHNRDLAPTAAALLEAEGIRPAELTGVMVSVGPGSFTGLRVGVMSAKVLAYATGCRLVAVPTFHAIAGQSPAEASVVEVIADALQGLAYSQRFRRVGVEQWEPANELRIEPAADWASRLTPELWVSGPGVEVYDQFIPAAVSRVPDADRMPGLTAIYQAGLRQAPLTAAEVMRLEPLYLRPSSAEEKAARGQKSEIRSQKSEWH
ncbi:MAG TPA: tRNA (adenosine(37)-N6)-threonylcarbamoyltransferase complex dimerization subunit type 1 TsaB [Fimbriiglobus sp.]|nr:tRNA (adenosine(37)-N6)-threonylcarbamoyltransferase complex dimerization subunit type 1 TsaB [Fimbriiglobus sp.]